jgi:hypothetical protein
MKNVTKLIAATLLTLGLMTVFATTAKADVTQAQNQQLNQDLKIECQTGAYGQNSFCTAEGHQNANQAQSQTFVTPGGRVLFYTHTPVDTGLSNLNLIEVGTSITAALSAGALTIKKLK